MMNMIQTIRPIKHLSKSSTLVLALALGLLPVTGYAQTVRPAVGKALQQAESLISRHDYAAALAKIRQADAVGHLSPYESVVVNELRGAAAAGAGDNLQAANAYENVLASGSPPPATRLQLIQAIGGFYYSAQDDKNAQIWLNRYIANGGNDLTAQTLLAQSYYRQRDYPHAEQIVWQEKSRINTNLAQPALQLAANAAQRSGDSEGYWNALKALLVAYPSQSYWTLAIGAVVSSPNFPDRLELDAYRLRRVTGTLSAAGDYEDYTERAILAGQPQEASLVINQGFSSGVLNETTDSGHARRLRTLAAHDAQTVQNTSASLPTDPLDNGIALASAGDSNDAVQAFESVPGYAEGQDGEAKLAQLWVIAAKAVRH